jgi:hypothetical protein
MIRTRTDRNSDSKQGMALGLAKPMRLDLSSYLIATSVTELPWTLSGGAPDTAS